MKTIKQSPQPAHRYYVYGKLLLHSMGQCLPFEQGKEMFNGLYILGAQLTENSSN